MPSSDRPFAYPLGSRHQLPGRGEAVVVACSQSLTGPNKYRFRFLNAKGRPQEVAMTEAALQNGAAPAGRKRKVAKRKA